VKVLITAGSTQVPIDRVRSISNIFKGKTGKQIAQYFSDQGDDVTLITSSVDGVFLGDAARIVYYRTYDELMEAMKKEITSGEYDVVIHSAAVSDYRVAGTYIMKNGELSELDSSGKVGSDHDEIFLRLVPTEKIIDLIRDPWGFKGVLVKFKLQVGVADGELIEIAQKSAVHSNANMIVANCLEWMNERAYIVDASGDFVPVIRKDLPQVLWEWIKIS
jgi:phosphopantothenate-cysteine ligase/phosphopantothenoylcysteine decarboxylase/phosphopantothenate--cysteine ligase